MYQSFVFGVRSLCRLADKLALDIRLDRDELLTAEELHSTARLTELVEIGEKIDFHSSVQFSTNT